MIFERLNLTKDKELKYISEYKRQQLKRYDLMYKPTVYEREYDFSNCENIEKYGLEKKKYIYIGSHECYSMNARSSKQANSSKSLEDEFYQLFKKYIEYYINEVEPELTKEEVYEKLYYDFFYSNICYFYVDTLKEARELETKIYNEAMLKYGFSTEYIFLIDLKKNDSSIIVEVEDNKITYKSKKAQNGAGIQPINLLKHTNKVSLINYTEEELYTIAFSCIGGKMTIEGKEIEITQDNFKDVFSMLLKARRQEN